MFGSRVRIGLALKFYLFISGLIILTSLILSWFFVNNQSAQLRSALIKRGNSLARNLAHNSEYGVLIANEELLVKLAKGLLEEEGLVFCSIEDREGVILASAGPRELKENIYEFTSPIITRRTKGVDEIEFYWLASTLERKEVIGTARIGISPANMLQEITRMQTEAVFLTFIVVLAGVLLAIFLVRTIVRPLQKLVLGIHRVAEGDLSYKVEVSSRDEIEELANAFNRMTRDLEQRRKELKATQAQLIQSAKMAAVGQLGAGVAHELNNPLGGILGYAQFILEKLKQPNFGIEQFKSTARYLESIEQAAARCKGIVENLLKFSRRPIVIKPEPIDIGLALQDTLSIIGHQLKLKNVDCALDIKPGLAKVMGIVNQLQQVFTNLILNAQQAMPSGGQLKISAENILDEKSGKPAQVRIEFSDSGCGMSEENLAHLFEPFFTTKQQQKGTGLGLAVSYEIIQEHKGSIKAKSKLGEGTTFSITLPAVAA